MKNSPHRFKHQKNKAIRQAQDQVYQTDKQEIKDDTKQVYVTSEKTAKKNRARANPQHKHHKTSPKDVTWETEPDSIHREGAHWINVIRKQTKDTMVRLCKKLGKINLFKR